MPQTILEHAQNYTLKYDYASLENEDIRAKSPVLFVVLGNTLKESISTIKQTLDRKLMNAKGAVYFYIGSDDYVEEENVISLSLPFACVEPKIYRSTLNKQLVQDLKGLTLLNEKVLKIKTTVLEQGKIFNGWEHIYISIITAASDPINVLLPEVTVLLQKKLGEDFKQVFTDLFVIVEETTDKEIALKQAMTMSFFKEVEHYQNKDYVYSKPIELLPGNIKVNLTHEKALFNLVYILTDKQENGQKIREAKKQHYETIAYINLLKNRYQKNIEDIEAKEQYNNALFINNIGIGEQYKYACATLAKVKKPEIGIYMTVAYYLYKAYKDELAYRGTDELQALLDTIGLSEGKLNHFVCSILPSKGKLEDIHSLMSRTNAFKELKNVSFKDAEVLLYDKACQVFFEINFTQVGEKEVKNEAAREALKNQLVENVINHPDYGPYAIRELFKEQGSLKIEGIKEQILFKEQQLALQVKEAEQLLVGHKIGSAWSLFDKKYLRDVKDYLINEIYSLKYKLLGERLKIKQIERLKDLLEELYEEIKGDIIALDAIGEKIKHLIEESERFEEAYLVQNVSEYYEKVVAIKLDYLQKTKGKAFFHEEKFMGGMLYLLKQDEVSFFTRLCEIEEKYILTDEGLFGISFEEELLERANIATTYENEEVVAKSDLYKMLYESLEENSKPCVYLDTTTVTNRYEEKYFFGDRTSEFIAYAYERDKTSRSYKIGCINDKKKSGVEKIQLMGGFEIEDLVLTRVAKRYYEVYLKEGYKFHEEQGENREK